MPKISVDEIFKEAALDIESSKRWLDPIASSDVSFYVANMTTQAIQAEPGLLTIFLRSKAILCLLRSLMAFSFEAGRLYGRSELTREIYAHGEEKL